MDGSAVKYVFVRNAEGKGPYRGIRYKWDDNNKMDLKEKEWEGVSSIILFQDCYQWPL
jgi:hypothetical protein